MWSNEMIDEQEVFEFLDVVRESGLINMLGAGPTIEEMFEVDKQEARRLLGRWMETFGERHEAGD
jgi:hypothetical protein